MSPVAAEERTCPGRLVVHADGSVAFCSEESEGRMCLGYAEPHASEPDTCWAKVAGAVCGVCDRQR
jgi:hypothetical protein